MKEVSIDVSKWISSVIEDYKEKLWYPYSSEVLSEIKTELIAALQIIPSMEWPSLEFLENVESLTKNQKFLDRFSDNEKWNIYTILAKNYALLWDIKKSLENYKKAHSMGYFGWYKEYIYIDLIYRVLQEWFVESALLFDFENDIEEVLERIWEINMQDIKQDLENFILKEPLFIENPYLLSDYFYNFEAEYDALEKLSFNWIDISSSLEKLKSKFKAFTKAVLPNSENYLSSLKDFTVHFENLINWKKIDYMFFSKVNYNFLFLSFNIMDTFLEKGEKDNFFSLFKFIVSRIKSVSIPNIWFIIAWVDNFSRNYPELKEEISKIFYSNIEWLAIPKEFSLLYIDLSITLWNLQQAFIFLMQGKDTFPNNIIVGKLLIILDAMMDNESDKEILSKLREYFLDIEKTDTIPADADFYKLIWEKLDIKFEYKYIQS